MPILKSRQQATLTLAIAFAFTNPIAPDAFAQTAVQQAPQAAVPTTGPPTPIVIPRPKQAPPELAKLLESKDRAAWEAFKRKDRDAYAKFLTDDFQAVESDGDGERARYKVLREVDHALYSDYLLQLFQVEQLGPDYALVTYESSMRYPKPATVRTRRIFISEIWVKQNSDWKLHRYQETVVR
jgi:hypothetical protein